MSGATSSEQCSECPFAYASVSGSHLCALCLHLSANFCRGPLKKTTIFALVVLYAILLAIVIWSLLIAFVISKALLAGDDDEDDSDADEGGLLQASDDLFAKSAAVSISS